MSDDEIGDGVIEIIGFGEDREIWVLVVIVVVYVYFIIEYYFFVIDCYYYIVFFYFLFSICKNICMEDIVDIFII